MKSFLTALLIAAAQAVSSAGEPPQEIASHEDAFHHALHTAPGMYLVCYYQVEKLPWGNDWEQLNIKATIVEVINGERQLGERIEFKRVLDGKYGDVSKLTGSLHYVQYHKNEDKNSPAHGTLEIDAQDPHAVFRFRPELSTMAADHKSKASQPAGGGRR